MMADDEGGVPFTTPENIAILQAEVAAKRQRKADRPARRQTKVRNRLLRSQATG